MTSFVRAIACLLAAMVAFAGGTAALAHTDLESSTPADGAVLDSRPTELTFVFAEPLLPDFVRFVATDPAGATTELGVSTVDGGTAVVAWPAEAAAGPWTVEYRVVSQDGHPVNGNISFSYDAPRPEPTSSSATPIPTTSAPSTPSATNVPTSAAPASTAVTSPSPSAQPASDSSSSTGWILAGLAVFALAAVAIAGLIARQRSQ